MKMLWSVFTNNEALKPLGSIHLGEAISDPLQCLDIIMLSSIKVAVEIVNKKSYLTETTATSLNTSSSRSPPMSTQDTSAALQALQLKLRM